MRTLFAQLARMLGRIGPWMRTGIWTVLDQGLFAGSNFALNVLLARWLPPEEYGAFTVAFTVFLLLGMLHTGFLAEPMLVFGAGRHSARLQGYLAVLLRGQLGFAFAGALVLAAVGVGFELLGEHTIGVELLVLALAQPFILMLWLLRQACYIRLRPKWAASGGILYAVLLLSGAAALNAAGIESAVAAIALMSGASLGAAAWLFVRLGLARRQAPPTAGFRRQVLRDHWDYGRWAAGTGVLEWVPGYLAFLLLPLAGGLAASATLKALLNLIMPALHVYAALCMMLVPVFVEARSQGRFRLTVMASMGLLGVLMLGYSLFLGFFGEPLMHLLYGGGYTEQAGLLWAIGLIPFLSSIASVLRTALRALERPNQVFWTYLASSAVAVTVSAFLIFRYGLYGAVASFFVQLGLEIVLMSVFVRRSSLSPAPPAAPQTTPLLEPLQT